MVVSVVLVIAVVDDEGWVVSVIEDVEELSFFVEVKLVSVDVEAVVANDVVTVGKYVLVVAIVVVVYVVLVIVVVDEDENMSAFVDVDSMTVVVEIEVVSVVVDLNVVIDVGEVGAVSFVA